MAQMEVLFPTSNRNKSGEAFFRCNKLSKKVNPSFISLFISQKKWARLIFYVKPFEKSEPDFISLIKHLIFTLAGH